MRRLLTVLVTVVCAILLLGAIYLALPTETTWTLDDASILDLTHEQLTNDYWQWRPAPDRELYAMARAEYLTQKIVFPRIIPRKWGYQTYYKFRLTDRERLKQIQAAIMSDSTTVRPYQRKRAEEPIPDWWHPVYSVVLQGNGNSEVYLIDPAEEDLAYATGTGFDGTL